MTPCVIPSPPSPRHRRGGHGAPFRPAGPCGGRPGVPPHESRQIPGNQGYWRVRPCLLREQLLDEAVLFVYHAPHSYTGEDVAEFCCHGGEFVLSQVLAAVIAAGPARAEAGEYTPPRPDERPHDLDRSRKRSLISWPPRIPRVSGPPSAPVEGAPPPGGTGRRRYSTDCCAHISAWIDYPEEDVEEVSPVLLARLNRVGYPFPPGA